MLLVNKVAVNSTSVLVAQLLLRSGDVETNPGPANGQKRSRPTHDDDEEDEVKSKISKEDDSPGTSLSLKHGQKRSRSTNDDGAEDGFESKISKQASTEDSTGTSSSTEQSDSTLRVSVPIVSRCTVPLSQSAKQLQVAETPLYKDEDLIKIIRDNRPEVKPVEEIRSNLKGFCRKVKVILHTVNDNEKWAVLEYMNPPVLQEGQPAEKLIDLHEPNWITLGMFGGYSCAMIQTEMGDNARKELEKALSEFPNAKVVIAIGVAYARNPDKAKLGDVLVSTTIDGISNIKFSNEGKIILREGPTRWAKVSQLLTNVFTRGKETWCAERSFKVNTAGENESSRISKVHAGIIVSFAALVDNKEIETRSWLTYLRQLEEKWKVQCYSKSKIDLQPPNQLLRSSASY